MTKDDINASFQRIGRETPENLPLCDFVAPLDRINSGGEGSTDVGDVSWVVPTVQARVATCAVGTPFHTWQTVAQGKAPAAHKGMVHAAKVMAATAGALIQSPETLKAARMVHDERQAKHPTNAQSLPRCHRRLLQNRNRILVSIIIEFQKVFSQFVWRKRI